MGAWIETIDNILKEFVKKVAPCVGAWIETITELMYILKGMVAPCVGAWIETWADRLIYNGETCRTLRGCVD